VDIFHLALSTLVGWLFGLVIVTMEFGIFKGSLLGLYWVSFVVCCCFFNVFFYLLVLSGLL